MPFFKICDCGVKNIFENRGAAPRKCENCSRSLLDFSAINEDDLITERYEEPEKLVKEEATELKNDIFTYSLVDLKKSFSIKIPLSGGIVGRANLGAEALKNNSYVSREHIKLTYRGKKILLVEDLSKYGTFLNGEQLIKGVPKILRSGDIIKLYELELQLNRDDEELEI